MKLSPVRSSVSCWFTASTSGPTDASFNDHGPRSTHAPSIGGVLRPQEAILAASKSNPHAIQRRTDERNLFHYDRSALERLVAAVDPSTDGHHRAMNPRRISEPAKWASGRPLEDEERRCGMLCRVADHAATAEGDGEWQRDTIGQRRLKAPPSVVAARPPKSCPPGDPPADLLVPRKRLHAAIKCDPTDWQINEMTPLGDYVTVERRLRGRWKKISPKTTVDIEDDSEVPFGHPDKTFSKKVTSYGTYRHHRGPPPPSDRPWLQFQVYRESTSLSTLIHRMQRKCYIPSDRLCFPRGENQDEFGCVCHTGGAWSAHREDVVYASRNFNIRPISVTPVGYNVKPPNEPRGNHYRVVLRAVTATVPEVEAHLAWLLRSGGSAGQTAARLPSAPPPFINYVSLSAFGIAANAAFEIGAMIGQNRYAAALSQYLQNVAERDPIWYAHYVKYLSASDVAALPGILDVAVNDMVGFKCNRDLVGLVMALRDVYIRLGTASLRSTGLTDDLCKPIWEAWVPNAADYVHAARYFIWNAAASQRILSGGLKVNAGDLVAIRTSPTHSSIERSPSPPAAVALVRPGEEHLWSLDDLVLPFPTSTLLDGAPVVFPECAATKALYAEVAALHGMHDAVSASQRFWQREQAMTGIHPPSYRRLFVRPSHVEFKAFDDPHSLLAIKSDWFWSQELGNGSEERPPIFGLDEGLRIRGPSEFNVSVAFRDRMKTVLQFAPEQDRRGTSNGGSTVVLALSLPAGSHVSIILREFFSLRHVHYHDLLSVRAV